MLLIIKITANYPFWCNGHENEFDKLHNIYEKNNIFDSKSCMLFKKKIILKYKKEL